MTTRPPLYRYRCVRCGLPGRGWTPDLHREPYYTYACAEHSSGCDLQPDYDVPAPSGDGREMEARRGR